VGSAHSLTAWCWKSYRSIAGEDNVIFWDRLMLGEVQQVGKCLVWRSHNRVPSVVPGGPVYARVA
jgi:hypothetical protein